MIFPLHPYNCYNNSDMYETYFSYITDHNTIFVEFRTERGEVVSFTVKLLCDIQGMRHEVVRFDGGHGCPHMDILDPAGHVERKVWYDYLNNDRALTIAIADIKEHHEFYRERYIKWLKD